MKPIRKYRRKESTYLSLIDLGELEDFNLTGEESSIIERIHGLRKKVIRDFDQSDIKICLTQGIGIFYLIPKALEILTDNPFIETDHYPGDLFKACISILNEFWNNNPDDKERMKQVVKSAEANFIEQGDNSDRQLRKDLDLAITKFI